MRLCDVSWLLLGLGALATANNLTLVPRAEQMLDQKLENQIRCEGMYSRKAWGGDTPPFILTKFLPYDAESEENPIEHPTIAFVVFEWQDEQDIGIFPGPEESGSQPPTYVCDDLAVTEGKCTQEQWGKFILNKENSRIVTDSVDLSGNRKPINYAVSSTGYYCVSTAPLQPSLKYQAVVEFRNAYGELPAAQIAKLTFYGALTIVYAVIGVFWAFLYVQNRSDILPVQNYITATIIFLVVEMAMTWGYYEYKNIHGANVGSKVIMLIDSILNAGRNSLSFYLLLIVCLGWGVVVPSLGKKMLYARWLALTHFVFGVIYAVGSLTVAPEDAGPLVLLVVLPLAATGTIFYVWTLNALGATMKDLMERKQRVKALMYRRLWWCILGSVLVIFAFFFLNVLTFSGRGTADFTPTHWQTRWFVLDGWLNLVYLFDVAFIAYLWRPTANNRRFAMSEEISQEDDGFEIASPRDSLDFDDEEMNGGGRLRSEPGTPSAPPSYTANGGPFARMDSKTRAESPLPAPKPHRPLHGRAQSMEGETLFAVGDEMDSDDEGAGKGHGSHEVGSDDERRGLTAKGKDD